MAQLIPSTRRRRGEPDFGTPDPAETPDQTPQDAPAADLDRADVHHPTDITPRRVDVPALADDGPDLRPAATITATVMNGPGANPGELRPIVAGWMKSRAGWKAMTRWQLKLRWHQVRFHALRAPLYVLNVLRLAPAGLWILVQGLTRWALDTRTDGLEQELATGTKADSKEFRFLRQDRSDRVKWRLLAVALTALAALIVLGIFWAATAAPACTGPLVPPGHTRTGCAGPATGMRLALLALAVLALARVGASAGRPLIGRSMTASTGFRELTDAIVMRALRAAGLGGQAAKYDKDGNQTAEDTRPTLAAPIARSANGRGYEVLVDLPAGKTSGDAAAAVDRLASGLDVDTAQVFPEPVQGSARRVAIYVADEDPMLLPAHRSPLAKMPKVSVWDPQPIGRTPVGHEVRAPLLFSSYLIGAVPRAGKSYAAKCLVAPGALDPFCDVTALDCKGGRDWLPASQIAVDFHAGDDEDDLALILAILQRRRNEARERLASFRNLSDAEMPEDKLTRELAAAGMRPHLIVIDEIQNLLRAENKTIRKDALGVLTWLAKTAPAAGFSLVAITQRPAAEVVPADLRDIMTVRIALRTKTPQSSDAILGSFISAQGFRTDRFLENHKGAAVVGGIPTGRGGDLQVVRTDLLTPTEFNRACTIGRQRRQDAGTLRGQAAGEATPVVITVTVVDDVSAVWPREEPKVQAHVILSRLREHFPGKYADLDEAGLTRALQPHGIRSLQVFRDSSNRNGYQLSDIKRAKKAIEADDDAQDS